MSPGIIWAWCQRVFLITSLLAWAGCGTVIPIKPLQEEEPGGQRVITEKRPGRAPEVSQEQKTETLKSSDEASPDQTEDEDRLASTEDSRSKNQELLDSALEFIEASNDFWERGDLDNALDALDKAYSLILKVDTEEDTELLQQKEDLRFTISKRIIEVYASRFTAVNGYHKAIPLVMNHHVKKALDLLTGRERNFFLNTYRRSGKYRPAIVKALKEEGLPEDLSWLPLIESGFNVRALSRARALGLWQFIASTGYKFGLTRGQWVDERMDPEKSTKAAIAYLKELHQIFGDWTTVLAAYNCGERRVLNCIRTQKINYLDNFWDLYQKLPEETAFYVPKFLAVLHILNNPSAYGMELPPVEEEMETEEITVNKQVHLKTIGEAVGIGFDLLRDLNPELRHYLTPDRPYSLKVPQGKGELLLAKLNDLPVWQQPVPSYDVHNVRSGETLSLIAKRYKTSVKAIMDMNGLKSNKYLKVGWRLRIPGKGTTVSRLERPPVQTSKLKEAITEYEVKKGDSLWQIAQRFGTTTEVIRSLNHLKNSSLRIGQVLKISKSSATSTPHKVQTYRVQRGDYPYLIAKRHEMDLSEFLRLNKLTPSSTIFPGQTVLVRRE
ncbi:MAG: LysM peptidoglycan-binding domain-containing protein [Pseudomonadota bacterium]